MIRFRRAAKESAETLRLLEAAEEGDAARIDSLLKWSATRVSGRDEKGRTALMRAAANGHEAATRRLIAAGSSLDAQDKEGNTALILAAYFGMEGAARALLEAGASLDPFCDDGKTARDWAGEQGNRAVEALLEAEAGRRHARARSERKAEAARARRERPREEESELAREIRALREEVARQGERIQELSRRLEGGGDAEGPSEPGRVRARRG